MRILIACSFILASTSAIAQTATPYERAATEARNAGCRITSQSPRRLYATCRSREVAVTLVAKFREIAGSGQVVFGPLCSFRVAGDPATVMGCDAQIESTT